ncbi:MAG: trypsin-like peptidase domain-containing protein [Candidatus Hydrogenedentes bacterium]|nr:trypsin-like peptidase domain-containing protein [Candidatus Hydrogenedentota bacterium]
MKKAFILLLFAAILCEGCVSTGISTQNALIHAKNRAAPALVHIRPVKEVFQRGRRREVLITGSGFIISPDGYVVTNEHVAGGSSQVRCVLGDKSEVDAVVVGTDAFTDIAVLKLDTGRTDLPYVKLGASAGLEAGQTVMALGSPHGLARSVSMGIVSVTNRYLAGADGQFISPYNNWIQTDAAINPGNSGGPLVNLRGEVVGINTRRLSSADNVGFAIPIDVARPVVEEIRETGKVTRSTVGIDFQEMTRKTDDPAQHGVVISDVDPLSPAFQARIRPGDILTAVNGTPTHARFVEDLTAVRNLIAEVSVGDEVTLSIARGAQAGEVLVKTVEKGRSAGEQSEFEEWGCSLSELSPDVIREAQLTSRNGVVTTGVRPGGIASNAGLRPGDIILTIDGLEVENLSSFQEMFDRLVEQEKSLVLLTVKQGSLSRFVLLKQESSAEVQEGS